MPKTSPRVTFGLYNLEINAGSLPQATDLQPFSKPLDLKTGNIASKPLATYEPNYWLLDGQYKFKPEINDAVHVGLMSLSMSGSDGAFSTPPVLTVTFDRAFASDGLVLHFAQYSGDYADSIRVEYFDEADSLLASNTYAPTSWEFASTLAVNGFKKIIVTFYSTNVPYRYLRLSGIDYGQLISFTEADIKEASAIEQLSLLSETLPANSCELQLYSNDSSFSIVNPIGYYARLTQRQPLSVYELVDNNPIFMGRYYLDEWKNASDTEIHFSCIDAIGLLDRIPFKGGLYPYEGIKLQYLIDSIMNVAGLSYELDTTLYDILVMGWIPICSCREALQQVAFAVGAYVDCSRSNVVKIRKSVVLTGSEETIPITKAEKGQSSPLSMRELITSVEVTSHNYTEGTEAIQLFSGVLPAGLQEITFKEPVYSLSITGATILESGVNYADVMVSVSGAVTLTGKKYIDNQRLFVKSANASSVVTPNVLTIKNATLVNTYNGQAVTDRIFAYYQQRYLQKAKLFTPSIELGNVALVDSLNNAKIRGVVEKMTINLTGGFLADSDIVGVVDGME